jgi:hypothetical protein
LRSGQSGIPEFIALLKVGRGEYYRVAIELCVCSFRYLCAVSNAAARDDTP